MLFVVLIGLSIGQYQIISQNRKMAALSSRMLFQYTTIKEFVTKALLDRRYADLQDSVVDLENLNDSVQGILQNPLVPAQLKTSLLNRLDLSGVVILVRQIVSYADGQKIARLQEDIRMSGEQFLQFDRLIAEHVKRKVVGYQSFVIGVLLFSVLFLAQVLFFIYLKLVAPLKTLKTWLVQLAEEDGKVVKTPSRLGWLSDIGQLVPRIHTDFSGQDTPKEFPYNFRLAMLGQLACGVSHEIRDAVNSLLNYQELALDSMGGGAGEQNREVRQMLLAAGVESEKIASKVKLLLDAGLFNPHKDYFAVQQLCGETMALMRSQLRSDGIKVDQLFEPSLPRIHCSYGMARLVCLELMLWLSALITTTADRRITIRAEGGFKDGRPLVRLALQTSLAAAMLVEPGREGLFEESDNAVYSWRCLVLLKDYLHEEGGDLQIKASGSGTTIIVDLPAEQPGERQGVSSEQSTAELGLL